MAHLGFSFNGDIEHNTIVFNQSLNPTIPTNGGGLMIEGTPDTDPVCGLGADADCPPGFSDGVGPGLVINANLIQGNAAEAGSGGGIRLQGVNGTEVTNFPTNPARWYAPLVTNNIIVNNVAGWDGGGVSLEDALAVNLHQQHRGFQRQHGDRRSAVQHPGCAQSRARRRRLPATNAGNTSLPQPAGLVTMQNSIPLTAALARVKLTCPANNPNCAALLEPVHGQQHLLAEPLVLRRRGSRKCAVPAEPGHPVQRVQPVATGDHTRPTRPRPANASPVPATGISAYAATPARARTRRQSAPPPRNFSGVLAADQRLGSGHQLSPQPRRPTPQSYRQYCNGSRVPPEFAAGTFNVPPGIADATVPNPLFTLQTLPRWTKATTGSTWPGDRFR